MRGDGVGVGDVGEVHGGARGSGHAAGGDDGRGAGRQHEQAWSMDVAAEHERGQPGGDGVGVGDGARGRLGLVAYTAMGAGGADGMRGDGVGVGDVGEVHGGAWGSGHAAGGDDGRGARAAA